MRTNLKNIIPLFSLFIGLVLFSHAIIPHDHHFQLFNDHSHDDNKNDTSDKNKAHCFYFNDVIIQKSTLSANKSINKLVRAKFFAIKNISVQEALFFVNNTIYSIPYFPENKILTYSSPTRGSPFSI